MKLELAPSILSCDPSNFRPAVKEIIESGVDWIHFDVMDGQFVPPITFGADLVASLRALGDTRFEAHLMTATPEAHFETFARAGCQRIIFHTEATVHAHRLIQRLHDMGLEAGIAINPGTPVESAMPLIDVADLVLVMTVNPGWGGQSFIQPCLDKVRALRARNPHLHIEVDGGIDPHTIVEAAKAGANVFVSGSFLMTRPTIADRVQELRTVCA